ncbi:MAG: LruC domain-containing protein [Bacteroidales bacterium]
MKKIRKWMLLGILPGLVQVSCLKRDYDELMNLPNGPEVEESYVGFDFRTITRAEIRVSVTDPAGTPVHGAYLEIFGSNPLDGLGQLRTDSRESLLARGITGETGIFATTVAPPSYTDSIFVLSHFPGMDPLQAAALDSEDIRLDFGGRTRPLVNTLKGLTKSATAVAPQQVNGFYVLGTWNGNGVPDYLEAAGDVISAAFLDDVNASLPEYINLPVSHPQYLASSTDASLVLKEDAEVWITFVHEGAGWTNALGYYTYPTTAAPQSIADLTDRTVVFPNVSTGSGLLQSGDKVQLQYLDPATGEYSPIFPAGHSIGWFLAAQGWKAGQPTGGVYIHYSDPVLNQEPDPSLKKHNVLLYDELRELLLIGFEDVRRDQGADQDFNDAIFYVSANPVTAVESRIYQPLDTPTDTDNDGVSDVFDEFPLDPTRSFSSYYPSENGFGTLVYEDLWPYKGDYDFNDLVLDYNFSYALDALNRVEAIQARFVVRAIGASYHNAFGLVLRTPSSNIVSVEGQRISREYLDLAANGAENGQSEAVIFVFDDAFNALPYPGTGIGVNVSDAAPYVTPDTLQLLINLNTSVAYSDLGLPPYNPFIVVDRNRGVEVHLPGSAPTDLANVGLFGTGDDDTNPNAGSYYMSDTYLPWAINLPESFVYAKEKLDVRTGHLQFNTWAVSRGFNAMDWYRDQPGYRDVNKLYNH